MKLTITYLLLAFGAPLALARSSAEVQKPVLISYPKDTDSWIVDEAKDAIKKAGGAITHEFHLITGFAANAPAQVLDMLKKLEAHAGIHIEDDKVISVNNSE